jgi:hypothetical protein
VAAEKIVTFFLEQSFKIMITGFVMSTAGLIMYIKMQHKNPLLEKIAWGTAATGLGFWLIGRIGIAVLQRRRRKEESSGTSDKEQG